MNERQTPLKRRGRWLADLILAVSVVLLVLTVFIVSRLLSKPGVRAVVSYDGEEIMSFDLSENIEKAIYTGDDYNILVIRDGAAYISDANCRDGICVAHRSIKYTGESIICLPHRLVISIEDDYGGRQP